MMRDDRLEIGTAVPGPVLPAAAVAVALAAAALLGAPPLWLAVAGGAIAIGAFAPTIGGPWIAAAVLTAMLVAGEPHPARTALVIAAVHLLHVLGSLSLVVPLRARIALPTLRPTAVRFVVVQAAGQAAGLLASLLPQARSQPIAVLAAATAVLLVALAGRRMLRRQRRHAFPGSRPSPSVGDPS